MPQDEPIDWVEYLFERPLQLRHKTCGEVAITQRLDARDGQMCYWCDTCQLFIHPTYAKEVLEELSEF